MFYFREKRLVFKQLSELPKKHSEDRRRFGRSGEINDQDEFQALETDTRNLPSVIVRQKNPSRGNIIEYYPAVPGQIRELRGKLQYLIDEKGPIELRGYKDAIPPPDPKDEYYEDHLIGKKVQCFTPGGEFFGSIRSYNEDHDEFLVCPKDDSTRILKLNVKRKYVRLQNWTDELINDFYHKV